MKKRQGNGCSRRQKGERPRLRESEREWWKRESETEIRGSKGGVSEDTLVVYIICYT